MKVGIGVTNGGWVRLNDEDLPDDDEGCKVGRILKEAIERPKVSWKQSFAVRFAVVWALVLGSAVGLSGWFSYRDARHQLLGSLNETVAQDARVVELRLMTWMETLIDDTRSASNSPVVEEFLKVRGTEDEGRWRKMVEDGFRAVFAGKSAYIQMRLLEGSGPNEGREIVRLNREGNSLVATPERQLQEKGGRDYFEEALAIPRGEVYVSEINLNRDFGEISTPRLPTVRAAIWIGNGEGDGVMLIINADLRLLFAELRQLASDDAEIYLGDEKRDYLMHEDEAFLYTSDLGHGEFFEEGKAADGVSAEREMRVGRRPERRLFLRVALADESWRPVLAQAVKRGIWTTVLASLGGAALALVIAWFFARRLGKLTKALKRFDGTEGVEEGGLSDAGRDEIGVAIARFEEMAGKVRDHVEELHRAREGAEEAEAAKENFLAVMSHEIRTPMNAVVGLVGALESNDPGPQQEPILASLKSSTNNLMTLLNTALDYTRLHEGAMRYENVHFDLAALAREVVDELRPLAMSKGLVLEASLPDELWVEGDGVRLRQVLNNLLNNGLKFTEEGFVSLAIWHEAGEVVGKVADSGPGIAGSEMEKVFEPFYSRLVERNGQAAGAGLGLSVSHEMIVQQGGNLTVACPPGGGAIFRFEIPFPRVERKIEVPDKDAGDWQFGKKKILYVEDTPSNQEVMELTLAGSGLELSCVETGTEALEELKKKRFDLVMVDLQLPDGSGLEWAEEMKKKKIGMPVILVTAQTSAKKLAKNERSAVEEVILKPYTKDLVLEVLGRHLRTDFSQALLEVHPDDSGKRRRLAESMAREFREASARVRSVNPGQANEVVAELRHQLTTALARFPMAELEAAFDNLDEGEVIEEGLARLAEALERAGEILEETR